MNFTFKAIRPQLDRLQRTALIAGVIGIVLAAVGAVIDTQQFFQAYLFAFLFWLGLTTGSLFLLMLHHTVGGGWGFIIRRPLEAAVRLLPLMAILFLPIALGVFRIYGGEHQWARPYEELDDVLKAKSVYLNVPFFWMRAVIYFVIWGLFAFFAYKWSGRQDETNDPRIFRRLNLLGAWGIVIYVLTLTFAAVDWGMSLTPHWFSSIYGLIFVVGQGLSTLAFMVIIVASMGGGKPFVDEISERYSRDLGNLMLAGTLLWAYTAFSQYVIIYSGNLAEEATWYVMRKQGGWQFISISLIVLHFALPFLTLLSSTVKIRIQNLAKIAAFILFMRLVDLFWLTQPTFNSSLAEAIPEILIGLATLVGMGGIWLWLWAGGLKLRPLLPAHDPRFEEHWPLQEVAHHG